MGLLPGTGAGAFTGTGGWCSRFRQQRSLGQVSYRIGVTQSNPAEEPKPLYHIFMVTIIFSTLAQLKAIPHLTEMTFSNSLK